MKQKMCKNCGNEMNRDMNFCEKCGKKQDKSTKSLTLLKNIIRVLLIIVLLFLAFLWFYFQTYHYICFIICAILLIPPVANLLYTKIKINRALKYILMIIIFIVGLSGPGSTVDTNTSSENNNKVLNNDNVGVGIDEEKKLLDKEKENIIEIINRNISSTYKYKNVIVEKKEEKYIVTIPFQSGDRYADNIWCGIDGISVINSIKDYHSDLDKKIEKYVLEFYVNDEKKYISEIINSDAKLIEIAISDINQNIRTITKTDIDNHLKEEINSFKTESTTTFDESNINKSIKCNDKNITVKKLKRITKNESSYVPEGNEWVGVYIVFENESKEDMNYYESDFNLVNGNGEVIKPMFNVIKGVFDHDRLNNGTLTAGGEVEGYVIFDNDSVDDKKLKLRIICQDNLIMDDKIETINLY